MQIALWIVQAILAIKLLTAAVTHGLGQSRPSVQAAIQKMGAPARPLLAVTAVLMLLGAIALIVPGLVGPLASLVPVTAAFLAILLLLGISFHLRCREKPNIYVGLVLFALAVFVAYGRWVLAPL